MKNRSHNNQIHFSNLDGLRALAIISVLSLHGSYGYMAGGGIGVDLFFVLSGFLITYLLTAEINKFGNVSLSLFYKRRALRLYPALFAAVILAGIFWSNTAKIGSDFVFAARSALFYYANLVPGIELGSLSSFWSLAVEEHFYIFWPVILICLLRFKFKNQIALIMIAIISCTIVRYLFQINLLSCHWIDPYRFTLTRMDCLLAGCLIAFFFTQFKEKMVQYAEKYQIVFFGLIVIYMFMLKYDIRNQLCVGYTLIAVLCAAIVAFGVCLPSMPLLCSPLARWLASRSYGIYLYHLSIFEMCEKMRVKHSILNFLLVSVARLILALLAAEVSYQFIEKYALKFKERFTRN